METWEGKVRIGGGREGQSRGKQRRDLIIQVAWASQNMSSQVHSSDASHVRSSQVKVGKSSRFKLDRIG